MLGQNVNAYKYNGLRLSNLILEIENIDQIQRIRYTTSHPKDMTDDLIEVYKHSKKLMPLIHLPIQSGSNKILDLMNRKHSIKEYLDIYEKLKKINNLIEFSSDFIIGYPGENEKEFNHTYNLIRKLKFINSYSFVFSLRPGTTAEKLKLIDKDITLKRLKKIQSLLNKIQIEKNKSLENKSVNVLIENQTEDKTMLFGRTEYMTAVILEGKKNLVGQTVNARIINSNQNSLFGKVEELNNKKVA